MPELTLILDGSCTQSSHSFVYEQVESLISPLNSFLFHLIVFKDYKSLNPVTYILSTSDSKDILKWIKSYRFTGGGYIRNAILEGLLYGCLVYFNSFESNMNLMDR